MNLWRAYVQNEPMCPSNQPAIFTTVNFLLPSSQDKTTMKEAIHA